MGNLKPQQGIKLFLLFVVLFSSPLALSQGAQSCKKDADKQLSRVNEVMAKSSAVQSPCAEFDENMLQFRARAQSCIDHIRSTESICDKNTGNNSGLDAYALKDESIVEAAKNNNNLLHRQYLSLKAKLDSCASKLNSAIKSCTGTYDWALSWGEGCRADQTQQLLVAIQGVVEQAEVVTKICTAFDNLYLGRRQQIAASKNVRESRQVYEEVKQ